MTTDETTTFPLLTSITWSRDGTHFFGRRETERYNHHYLVYNRRTQQETWLTIPGLVALLPDGRDLLVVPGYIPTLTQISSHGPAQRSIATTWRQGRLSL